MVGGGKAGQAHTGTRGGSLVGRLLCVCLGVEAPVGEAGERYAEPTGEDTGTLPPDLRDMLQSNPTSA